MNFTQKLLIEPVWNWNFRIAMLYLPSRLSFNRTSMELKHTYWVRHCKRWWTFNRTSMELKRQCHCVHCLQFFLLIEPVWNWNTVWKSSSLPNTITFNRTSMELKPGIDGHTGELYSCLLIEPVWNWNTRRSIWYCWGMGTFNRTSMELKRA